jgi:hypothetical protein
MLTKSESAHIKKHRRHVEKAKVLMKTARRAGRMGAAEAKALLKKVDTARKQLLKDNIRTRKIHARIKKAK